MKQVVDFVDDEAITRNSNWLLKRRKNDGSGQFNLNERALDTFGRASQDITDVYILWTLTQIEGYDYEFLKDEFRNLEAILTRTNDPYILGLAAGALFNVDKLDQAREIGEKLAGMQNMTSG